MPEITIQDSTFERLQRHAKPFVDTPETVILRGLNALESSVGSTASDAVPSGQNERLIDPRALPNLTHTKVLDASIDGESIAKPNWNLLLHKMLVRAMRRAGSFDKLRQACPVNMVEGQKDDEGFGFLPEINISVQGQDANVACRALVTAARTLGISIDVGFMWRMKEAAAFRGERARIQIANTANRSAAA